MTARDGMANLILRLRSMTDTSTSDYTVNSVAYWTDDHLEDALDSYCFELNGSYLEPIPEVVAGDTVHKNYYIGKGDLEEASSGTAYWRVETSQGDVAGTADYSVDYIGGKITFNSDQSGTAWYLRARAYNLNRAAADVWRRKAAHYAVDFDFRADDQQFNRSQKRIGALEMAKYYEKESGGRSVRMKRGDLA